MRPLSVQQEIDRLCAEADDVVPLMFLGPSLQRDRADRRVQQINARLMELIDDSSPDPGAAAEGRGVQSPRHGAGDDR